MRNVHRVIASGGEYEDRFQYTVMTYSGKTSAQAHARAANQYARDHRMHHDTPRAEMADWDARDDAMEANPYDPGGSRVYTGVSYSVASSPIATGLREGLDMLAAKLKA